MSKCIDFCRVCEKTLSVPLDWCQVKWMRLRRLEVQGIGDIISRVCFAVCLVFLTLGAYGVKAFSLCLRICTGRKQSPISFQDRSMMITLSKPLKRVDYLEGLSYELIKHGELMKALLKIIPYTKLYMLDLGVKKPKIQFHIQILPDDSKKKGQDERVSISAQVISGSYRSTFIVRHTRHNLSSMSPYHCSEYTLMDNFIERFTTQLIAR